MLAVIKTGGKQYLVEKGSKLKVEKLPAAVGKKVTFKEVLLLSDPKGADLKLGQPVLKGVQVEAKVLKQARLPKVTTIKHRPKKRYLIKKGHKQPYTEIEITKI